jgi:hypothetical protein
MVLLGCQELQELWELKVHLELLDHKVIQEIQDNRDL